MNSLKYLIFSLILLATGSAFASQMTYEVYANTTVISGQSGYLDFQFNPGNNAQAATATVMNFSPYGGVLTGPSSATGTVNGDLPTTVTLGNTAAWNDYFQGFIFANLLHFSVRLDGPALTAPNGTAGSGSEFGFSMYAADGFTPLLTQDPNGFAMTASVMPDGTTVARYDYGPNTSAVPEPSTYALLCISLGVVGYARRKMGKN